MSASLEENVRTHDNVLNQNGVGPFGIISRFRLYDEKTRKVPNDGKSLVNDSLI